ncbi:MAG: NifU family protein [Sandaracinaceae bacterium]
MSERGLETLVRDLESLEKVIESWDDAQRGTVQALRTTVEEIQAGAFRRLIRAIKDRPEGLTALKAVVRDDPWVFNVLTYHGLLRPPEPSLEDRLRAALASVRPMLASHDGDVELVGVVPPDEVQIRLLGTCDGCNFSDDTLRLGIEKAIYEAAPEVRKVSVVQRTSDLVQLGLGPGGPAASPFALPWEDAGPSSAVPEGGLRAVELDRVSVLLTAAGGEVRAYPNACTHLGMPLADGAVEAGVLTCRYHGFRYLLSTGECLTAPDVQLPRFPVKVEGGRVLVQVPR